MFGFGKRRRAVNREILKAEFEEVILALRRDEESVQVAVGVAINMASSMFHKKYSSAEEFQKIPYAKRIA